MALTIQRLKELLSYNPATGWFTNLTERRPQMIIGSRAGSIKCGGRYRMIALDGVSYYEHHLAWFYVYGYMPDRVDHIDGKGCFNAIENLREASQSQNIANAKFTHGVSGLRGAYWRHSTRNWFACLHIGGRGKYLGSFDTAEEAHAAYCEAAELYFGEFAFHTRPQSEPQPNWRRF